MKKCLSQLNLLLFLWLSRLSSFRFTDNLEAYLEADSPAFTKETFDDLVEGEECKALKAVPE